MDWNKSYWNIDRFCEDAWEDNWITFICANISPNKSKKILFLSPYPNSCAAGQRFKFENAIEILEK